MRKYTNPLTLKSFCQKIWDGEVDGLLTSEVAAKYQICSRTAWRWLSLIVKGKAPHYPGEYDESMCGVSQKDGRHFVMNGGDGDGSKSECNWFSN